MHRDEEGRNWSRRYKLNLEKLASKDLASVSEVIVDLELRDLETGLTLTGPCCRGPWEPDGSSWWPPGSRATAALSGTSGGRRLRR